MVLESKVKVKYTQNLFLSLMRNLFHILTEGVYILHNAHYVVYITTKTSDHQYELGVKAKVKYTYNLSTDHNVNSSFIFRPLIGYGV